MPLLTWKQWGSSSRLGCSGQTRTSRSAPRSSSEIVASDSREPRALGGLTKAHVSKLSFLLTPLTPRNLPSTAERVEGSQREPEPKLDLNPSLDT